MATNPAKAKASVCHHPRHPRCGGGAEQVDQIVIEQAATLENRAKKAIDYGAEESRENYGGKLVNRHKTRSDRCHAHTGCTEQSRNRAKQAHAPVSACGNRFEVGYKQCFAGESHADFTGRSITGGLSQSSQRQHRPCFAGDGNNQRGDAKIGHGLPSGSSPSGLSSAELLFARIAHASGGQRDSKNDEQRQKHAQIADGHDESDG